MSRKVRGEVASGPGRFRFEGAERTPYKYDPYSFHGCPVVTYHKHHVAELYSLWHSSHISLSLSSSSLLLSIRYMYFMDACM